MSQSPFRFNVADLLGREASPRAVTVHAVVDWSVDMIEVIADPPLEADPMLHPVSGGVAVTGRARFATRDTCYRCLRETFTDRDTSIGALFDTNNDDDETYPLERHEIDFSQMLRDEVLLSLPIIEDCGDDCPGVVTNTQTDLNTDLSGDASESRSPFAVLKDLLEPESQSE